MFWMCLYFMQSKLQQLSCCRGSQGSILQCLFYWLSARQSTWALPKASHFHTALIPASPSCRFACCVPRKERKKTQQDISSPEAETCYADVIIRLGYDNLLFLLLSFCFESLQTNFMLFSPWLLQCRTASLRPRVAAPPSGTLSHLLHTNHPGHAVPCPAASRPAGGGEAEAVLL